jgi:hypothetical protein
MSALSPGLCFMSESRYLPRLTGDLGFTWTKAKMELLRYLDNNFLTRTQLSAAAGIDATALAGLAGMPKPSYRLRLDVGCDSFFGAHAEQHQVDYYASGYSSWIGTLLALCAETDGRLIFDQRYRARLAQLTAAGITTDATKLNAGLGAHLDDEWNYFLDGTYGLCTRSGLPEDIASKEVAIAIVKELTSDRPAERALTSSEHERLVRAVNLLDAASAPFAPHELARSSRHRLVDQVRKDYGL